MKPIPLQPNLPTPTNCFGKPVPASQWYVCPNCKKESPLTKKWVGLTDEEIAEGAKQSWVDKTAFESAVWWAEEKLREKNT